MISDAWRSSSPSPSWVGRVTPRLIFARPEGFPRGRLTLNEGIATAPRVVFRSGTIEFDIRPLGYSDAGLIFHRSANGDGEIVYLRGNPDCPAADDCIQYAPIIAGHMQWDIYPNYQRPAAIAPAGWNHVRIDVVGATMRVFINSGVVPVLVVPKLQGENLDGGIALKGPAVYANLTIYPGRAEVVLSRERDDADAVRAWQVAAAPLLSAGYVDMPRHGWKIARAEPNGLVNLSRELAKVQTDQLSTAWLKTSLIASRRQNRMLTLGFARRVSLFLNGKHIFTGNNFYYPAAKRLTPDGRLDRADAELNIDLLPGRNELVAAVTDAWMTDRGDVKSTPYGWGLEAHLSHARASLQPRDHLAAQSRPMSTSAGAPMPGTGS